MLAVYLCGERQRPLAQSDAIIVLGARVMEDGTLSTTLTHRMNKACDIYEQGYAETIIVCGGQGANEPVPEADAMAEYLMQKGVPPSAILRELNSFDTLQNLVNAQGLMRERGLNTAIIVSSEYHIQRALWIARDIGLPATGAGALSQNLRRNRVRATFRETLSWLNYFSGGLLGKFSGLTEGGE